MRWGVAKMVVLEKHNDPLVRVCHLRAKRFEVPGELARAVSEVVG